MNMQPDTFAIMLDRISTFPRLVGGFFATTTGAVAGSTAPVSDVHWLQISVWVATAFAGFATGAVGIVRLVLDNKRATKEHNAKLGIKPRD